MEKRAIFQGRLLPYMLVAPQLAITLVFFYWPASQAVWQSFLQEDAFGLSSSFVGFENYRDLFSRPEYYRTLTTTLVFSAIVTALSLSIALLLAVYPANVHMAVRPQDIKGAKGVPRWLLWARLPLQVLPILWVHRTVRAADEA